MQSKQLEDDPLPVMMMFGFEELLHPQENDD